MSTDLSESLEALADRATSAGSPASGNGVRSAELWRRGRRRQVRRALATTVAVALVSAITGIGGATAWQRIEAVEPVTSPDGTMRLPERLYTPSPWLDGTDDAGPIGPLVAVLGAERRSWLSRSAGVVGVSATTGEYRFLDLPGVVVDAVGQDLAPSLSPDGSYLAYWVAGPTTAEPLVDREGGEAIGGIAVYDCVTGEVVRQLITSEHGLAAEGFAWAGSTLRATYGVYHQGGVDTGERSWTTTGQITWDLVTGEASLETELSRMFDTYQPGGGSESFVTSEPKGRGYVEVAGAGVLQRFELDRQVQAPPTMSPSGARVAGLWQRSNRQTSSGLRLAWWDLDPGDPTRRLPGREVPQFRANALVGWRDDDHVVVERWQSPAGYLSVDLETGQAQRLTSPPINNQAFLPVIAADAWSAPVVQAPEPDWPMDPRIRAVLIGLGVAVSCVVVVLWGRRRGRA